MPTKREREYYAMGFRDGEASHRMRERGRPVSSMEFFEGERFDYGPPTMKPRRRRRPQKPKKKRTLTAWQKFVRTNSKKKEFRLRGGKVNLKKLGIAYRKKTGKRKSKR